MPLSTSAINATGSPGLNKAFWDWATEGKNARVELQRIIDRMRNAGSEAQALAIATETFGAEGAQRMTTAVRNGTFAVDDLSKSFRTAKGAIEQANEATTTFAEEASELGLNKILSALSPVQCTWTFWKYCWGYGKVDHTRCPTTLMIVRVFVREYRFTARKVEQLVRKGRRESKGLILLAQGCAR